MVSYSVYHHATAAKSLQSCPTLRNPIDSSPPGFPIPGILQARTLEWVAISFSNEWKWKVKVKSLSRVWLFLTPWTAAYRAPPSMGFSRQEYLSGVPLPSPVYHHNSLYSLTPVFHLLAHSSDKHFLRTYHVLSMCWELGQWARLMVPSLCSFLSLAQTRWSTNIGWTAF